jgi:hypothetical protein
VSFTLFDTKVRSESYGPFGRGLLAQDKNAPASIFLNAPWHDTVLEGNCPSYAVVAGLLLGRTFCARPLGKGFLFGR